MATALAGTGSRHAAVSWSGAAQEEERVPRPIWRMTDGLPWELEEFVGSWWMRGKQLAEYGRDAERDRRERLHDGRQSSGNIAI